MPMMIYDQIPKKLCIYLKYWRKNKTQVSYGEAVGILLLDSPVPFIPGDVANAVLFFASPMSQWVTGTNLTVDGGGLA